MTFTETSLRAWLKPFVVASATQPDASPTHETSTNDAAPTQPDASPTRLRERDKVSLASKPTLFTDVQSVPVKPDRRTPNEQIADDALSRIRPRVEPHLERMTWSVWRTRNRRAAVDMAKAGMPADAIDAAHLELSERRGYVVMALTWVQDAAPARASPVDDPSDRLQVLYMPRAAPE